MPELLPPVITEQGNCIKLGVDTQVMYPEAEDERATAIAKSICAGCVAVEPCREFAMKNREPHGVWGGMTEEERLSLRNKVRRHRNGSRKRQSNNG